MGADKIKAEITREKLLKAALQVFSEKGFNAARLQDIAETAGVSRGAFYWHFKNKFDLYCTLFSVTFDHLLNDIYTILAKQISPIQKIREIILNISCQMFKDEDYRAMGILHYNIEQSKEVRCVMSHKIQEQHQWKENPIIELIKEGIYCGEIRADLNPKIIANQSLYTSSVW